VLTPAGRELGAESSVREQYIGGRVRRVADVVRDYGTRYVLLFVLASFIATFAIWLPDKFWTELNFRAMINSQAIILLLALAATIVLRTGDFDLSIASVMTLTAATSAVLVRDGRSLLLVVCVAFTIGVIVGLVNGFLIVKIGVSSFITTLGMMTALTGVAIAVTNSRQIYNLEGPMLTLARHKILDFPLRTWYGWVLVIVLWYVYERTPIGRYLLFIGGSKDAARLAGLNVDVIKMAAFVASSIVAALTGIVLAGFLGGIDPNIGPGFLLQPFTGAFLGATALHVGRFNALGTVIAVYLLVVGITGLMLLGAERWVNEVFNGGALVLAVTFARLVGGRRS
jgi:ribose transport system permease protein